MAGGQAVGMIEIRSLSSHSDLHEAVRLQREIWGFSEIELLPVRLFVVATKIGGQVFGAFDGSRMVGFLLAIPGIKPGGTSYLHGHMMGVLPPYRNKGVGRMLKLQQRKEAIANGVKLVEWTFDPLELKNASFNIERLGAVIRRYVLNQYGSTTSHLHSGMPTDRCVAEWYVSSDRVEKFLAGGRPRESYQERIEIPNAIIAWRTEDPKKAREVQQRVSEQFLEHFRNGLAVTGFERGEAIAAYLLRQWPFE